VADEPAVPPRSKSDIERDIAATRIQLGDTVDALSARLDVKSRVRTKVSSAIAEARVTVQKRPAAVAAVGVGTLVALVVLIRRSRS
jgi:hypothetical protein